MLYFVYLAYDIIIDKLLDHLIGFVGVKSLAKLMTCFPISLMCCIVNAMEYML